jgi:cytochrome c553
MPLKSSLLTREPPLKMRCLLFVAVVLCLSAFNGHAEGDAQAGKAKTKSCAICHGQDGNSTTPQWPKIAGQHANYLEEQLIGFRSGVRIGKVMNEMAGELSDQDIKDLAAYFSQQTPVLGETDPKLLPHGRKVYRGGIAEAELPACMACHGPNGQGNPGSGYPLLSGQHAEYIYIALQGYADGLVEGKNSYMMTDIARRMTDRDMRAVATYVEGLR